MNIALLKWKRGENIYKTLEIGESIQFLVSLVSTVGRLVIFYHLTGQLVER